MNDKTLYECALNRLSTTVSGANDFENICRIVAKFMFPDYNFNTPEGGRGTQDGGYDGYDPIKKAKLACSLEKGYNEKIKRELEKSKKNGDKQLFYFSNQTIPEHSKNKLKAKYASIGIELIICGKDSLSDKIDEYFKNHADPELYDLLSLSFLMVGERYRRGDAIRLDIRFNGDMYKKRILRQGSSSNIAETIVSANPLLDSILSCCTKSREHSFKHITLCGIAYIGKSFLMKTTFNALIDEFSDKRNHSKYKFIPFVHFHELKYYNHGNIRADIKNKRDPILIFLDGLDELNDPKQIILNNEIQGILEDNDCVRFVIAGRNSSFFNIEIFHKSNRLFIEKSHRTDDRELMDLMIKYKDTPVVDFLPIPMYRKFVLDGKITENTTLNEFYDILVRENLDKDKRKSDYSSDISPRMASCLNIDRLIEELSDFCYNLFVNKKTVFTENDLNKYFKKDEFLYLIKSSVIDYRDKANISFVSNFYYEYFVVTKLSTMGERTVIRKFFIRDKVNVTRVNVLMLFISYTKTKSTHLHNKIMRKLLKDSIESILISEFDSIPDVERYKYFKSILSKYKNEKSLIYYFQFSQRYSVLKNIDNMAERMQQLLPDCHKMEAIRLLKTEIDGFLQLPSQENIWPFANAVILLNPFIDDVWHEEEQAILIELSLPLIRFFLYNDLSKEIKGLLSEKIIFNWYNRYSWTTDWELLYKNISGNTCDLLSEIVDDREYYLKFNILACLQVGNIVNPLFFPIIRYAMKNKYNKGNEMAEFVPNTITDDYETPIIEMNSQNYELLRLIEMLELSQSEILNVLVFALSNNLYDLVKLSYNNPITILEEKLYNAIALISYKDYGKFSQYYFNINENGFDNRLFQITQTTAIENLKRFLLDEILDKKIDRLGIRYLICNLINSDSVESSLKRLRETKEKLSDGFYKDIVYGIFNNKNHILTCDSSLADEFNRLFPQEIEKNKHLEYIKIEIESVRSKDFVLIQNPNMMIDELRKINNFMLDTKATNNINPYDLCHDHIIHTISYIDESYNPPIVSECAINIMKNFYKQNICDIEIIIKNLQENYFKEDNFYLYFYWFFVETSDNIKNIDIRNKITTCHTLVQRIIDSTNKDVSKKIIKPLVCFDVPDNHWLIPFFYYYEILFGNAPPTWMQTEHILKLIAIPYQYSNVDMFSVSWLCRKFPIITPRQLLEYGLKNIDNIKTDFSRTRIRRFFIDYYKTNIQDALTKEILNHFINITKRLFDSSPLDDVPTEYQDISLFWAQCDSNHIDRLFPNFTVETIISTIRKKGENQGYQCRKKVLLYCIKLATKEQKTRIIQEIELDIAKKNLSTEEDEEIHRFLASIGREDSVKYIINSYLNGKEVCSRFTDDYTLGFMKQSDRLLNNFIDLFIYCSEKDNERRRLLQNIAKKGIDEHLTKKNFRHFKKRIIKKKKVFYKEQSYWQSEYYSEYLLQMEQLVFS